MLNILNSLQCSCFFINCFYSGFTTIFVIIAELLWTIIAWQVSEVPQVHKSFPNSCSANFFWRKCRHHTWIINYCWFWCRGAWDHCFEMEKWGMVHLNILMNTEMINIWSLCLFYGSSSLFLMYILMSVGLTRGSWKWLMNSTHVGSVQTRALSGSAVVVS